MEAWYPADSIVFLSVAAADFRLASKSWAVYRMPLPGRWVVGPAELARGGGGARSVEAVAKATGRPRAFFSPDTD